MEPAEPPGGPLSSVRVDTPKQETILLTDSKLTVNSDGELKVATLFVCSAVKRIQRALRDMHGLAGTDFFTFLQAAAHPLKITSRKLWLTFRWQYFQRFASPEFTNLLFFSLDRYFFKKSVESRCVLDYSAVRMILTERQCLVKQYLSYFPQPWTLELKL